MCGIAGIIGNNIVDEYIHKMTSAIEHRGPDAEGFWNDGQCFFGHRRLSIIDLSDAANQPMVSHCGRYVMVYNGEIYNFKEIRHELNIACKTNSDTEVILEAFVILGPDFVHRLNGMFAIAIWDIEEKKLSLFRDRMGVKPIFYYHHNGMFAFASEIKAITAVPEIKKHLELSEDALSLYLHLGYIPQPHSVYSQIRKFPKGGHGVVQGGQLSIELYWSPEQHIQSQTITDEEEAIEKLESLLIDAVSKRMMSDVPFGTFLSGGIDSSLITALAQSQISSPLNTFTIGFKESKFNEAALAKEIAEFLGTKHHDFILSEKESVELLKDIIPVYDEPFADSSAIPTMLVSKMSREYVTMTLSGDGGDELFFGYGSYQWAKRLNNPLLRIFRCPIKNMLKLGSARMQRASWLFDYKKHTHLKSHVFSQEQYLFSSDEVKAITGNSFQEGFFNRSEIYNRKLSAAESQALFDVNYYLPDDLLVKVDRASMHYSLETRVPLLDYRIVEQVLNFSPHLKFRNDTSKYILKKILYKYIPKHYFERPKWGFSIPLSSWLRGEMNAYAMDYLHSDKLRDFLKLPVDDIYAVRRWKAGDDLYYNRIWQLVVLSVFLNR